MCVYRSTMALDINIRLFANGQQSGAHATAAGDPDGKRPSVPLAAALGAKMPAAGCDAFNAPGFFGGNGMNGIGEPSGSGYHYQGMVASSHGDAGQAPRVIPSDGG